MSSAAEPPQDLVAATERQLARLRFDLHDGPQQDVLLLAEDVRILRAELEAVMADRPERQRVLGLVDELQGRLVTLDADLRRLAAFVQSPFVETESVPEALAKIVADFRARSGIEPQVDLQGDFTDLSDSQQITLLNLVREALANIREHSQARHVEITVSAGTDGVQASVTDDGRGFDPQATLVSAADSGHLGLVGMYERVSLLGGRTRIDSRPGGPTVVSFTLPAWRPQAPERQG